MCQLAIVMCFMASRKPPQVVLYNAQKQKKVQTMVGHSKKVRGDACERTNESLKTSLNILSISQMFQHLNPKSIEMISHG